MALRTPPSWLQQASHPAENDRLTMQAIIATTGVIGTGSLAVTQNSPAGMSVLVASGWCGIVGTTQTNMGVYMAYNDATATVTIPTADPANPRYDIVCVTISDAYYTGALNQVAFSVVSGTPAGSPTVPTTPANSIKLANIYVGAGVSSILTANITDTRTAVTTNLPVGDITSVAAGTGLTGGGSSGDVTLSIDSTVATLTGLQTFTNKTLTNAVENYPDIKTPTEIAYTTATGFAGYTYDALTAAVQYSTGSATADGTVNFRGNGSTTFNSITAVGDSVTVVLMITNNATAYYPTAYQIDGVAVTPKWQGGTAPTAGNASAIDAYSFTIIKTAATPTYTVLASVVKFS